MKFGAVSPVEAEGSVLAHGVQVGGTNLRKGRILSAADVAALRDAGIKAVIVAQLSPDDVREDEAASLLAEALAGDGVRVASAFTGRANHYAGVSGVLRVKASAIDAINAIDESLTIATLPDYDAVTARAMLATVKIIPYAVTRTSLNAAVSIAKALGPVIEVAPYRAMRVGLISTELPQTKPAMHAKNRATLEVRLAAARATIIDERVVAHETNAIREGIASSLLVGAEMVLIYSASAIADRRDVVPAGLEASGGTVTRFGMPVDPGNLMLLGKHGAVTVVGLPGCARSPKLNGFDWVLQRLLAGLSVTGEDVARMGVGGLLKEIPSRPQPRDGTPPAKAAPRVAAIVLAAGQSRRMGATKQLVQLGGMAMVRRTVEAVRASAIDQVVVVTGHEAELVGGALKGLPVTIVRNPEFAQGLSTSLKAGLDALSSDIDAALITLADMPGVTGADIDRLIAGFDPAEGRGIVVPTHDGKRGNPVLWARAYFPVMARVTGDTGAKHLLAEFGEALVEVELGREVLTDIDTPEALAAFKDRA